MNVFHLLTGLTRALTHFLIESQYTYKHEDYSCLVMFTGHMCNNGIACKTYIIHGVIACHRLQLVCIHVVQRLFFPFVHIYIYLSAFNDFFSSVYTVEDLNSVPTV